jgi:hypothetical protein
MQYYMQHLFCQCLSGYEATNAIAPFLPELAALHMGTILCGNA